MILVDSCVLIDLLEADLHPAWADWSEAQLAAAAERDALFINVIVYAEIARSFQSSEQLDTFLHDLRVEMRDIPREAAFAASRAHRAYRARGGSREATLPDFFIAAHAQVAAGTLLTRDAARVRTYFPGLAVIAPPPSV